MKHIRTLLALSALLIFSESALSAQTSGQIVYTHTVKLEIELPPEMELFRERLPTSRDQHLRMHFTPEGSVTFLERQNPPGGAGGGAFRRGAGGDIAFDGARGELRRAMAGVAARARPGGPGGLAGPSREMGVLQSTHVSYADNSSVEMREFLGRIFRIQSTAEFPSWRMTTEQATHMGHMVIKAVAERDSSRVEAWFTPEIPVGGGPAAYGGLPGMILVISVDDGREQYFATEIELGEVDEDLLRPPEEGEKLSVEEYEEMVEEKIEEMRRQRRGGAE